MSLSLCFLLLLGAAVLPFVCRWWEQPILHTKAQAHTSASCTCSHTSTRKATLTGTCKVVKSSHKLLHADIVSPAAHIRNKTLTTILSSLMKQQPPTDCLQRQFFKILRKCYDLRSLRFIMCECCVLCFIVSQSCIVLCRVSILHILYIYILKSVPQSRSKSSKTSAAGIYQQLFLCYLVGAKTGHQAFIWCLAL